MGFFEVVVFLVFEVVVIFAFAILGRILIGSSGLEETDFESAESDSQPRQASFSPFRIDHLDRVTEVIGSYMGAQIYRRVVIRGVEYQFDHIFPPEGNMEIEEGACCLAPGLVYLPAPRTEVKFNHTLA